MLRIARQMLTVGVILAATIGGVQSVMAQTVMRQIHADGIFMIPELGAAVLQNKDTLKVDLLPPPDAMAKGYKTVDLKVGDLILMFNGKRMTSAKDMETMYKSLKIGDEIKLGIKREGALRIVSFAKADESKLPKRRIVMNSGPNDGGGKDQIQVKSKDGVQSFSGEGIRILPGAGLVLAIKDKHVAVVSVLPMAAEKISGGEVKEGDIIESANGKAVTSTADLMDIIEALADGTKVELGVARGEKKLSVSFTKTANQGQTIIRND